MGKKDYLSMSLYIEVPYKIPIMGKKACLLKIVFNPHIPQVPYFTGEKMETQRNVISSLQDSDQVFSLSRDVSLW